MNWREETEEETTAREAEWNAVYVRCRTCHFGSIETEYGEDQCPDCSSTLFVPVESVNIRWCMSHRRETWSGRTTCVGMGGDLTGSCNVVDALLMIGEDSTPEANVAAVVTGFASVDAVNAFLGSEDLKAMGEDSTP